MGRHLFVSGLRAQLHAPAVIRYNHVRSTRQPLRAWSSRDKFSFQRGWASLAGTDVTSHAEHTSCVVAG